MKIGFNFIGCGMGNNGGTRTIIKCSEILKRLGHKSTIISEIDNFTWFNHDFPVRKIPRDLEAIIATACTTVHNTLDSKIQKKAWYIRGHENWCMKERELNELYLRDDIIKICNSKGLKKTVEKHGAKDVRVVYQGVDFEIWNNTNIRDQNEKITIGCLHNKTLKTKKWEDFRILAQKLGNKKFQFVSFGSTKCEESFLKEHIVSPNKDRLKKFYNRCDIWFAPTESEGLHNPPIEAALCGCLVLCSNNPRNGMLGDYAIKDKTAMVYSNLDEACDMIRNPNYNLVKNMKIYIREQIGTREKNMKKLVEILQNGK